MCSFSVMSFIVMFNVQLLFLLFYTFALFTEDVIIIFHFSPTVIKSECVFKEISISNELKWTDQWINYKERHLLLNDIKLCKKKFIAIFEILVLCMTLNF